MKANRFRSIVSAAANASSTFSSSKRDLLKALPALAFAPTLLAQNTARDPDSNATSIPVSKLHSFALRVTDVQRSVDFYQALFGTAIQARQGQSVCLQIGDGPQFFSLSPVSSGEAPGIDCIGMSVNDFDLDIASQTLTAHGITAENPPQADQSRLELAMTNWIKVRGPDQGGEVGGTRELYFVDREGLKFQLSSVDHCGGSGPLGDICQNIQAAPSAPMRLTGLSHFTNFLANRDIANDFYRQLFGLKYQVYQGPTSPVIGVGDGLQFLMFVGGAQQGAPTQPGRIDHACFFMDDFDVEGVLEKLTNFGLTARQDPSDTRALMHWVSLRMPDRGGIVGGTPELYFSDPDGIRIQLQANSYCGGGGYLGDDCPVLA